MPTIEENRSLWAERYAWSEAGEEWSEAWGGTEAQWFGSVLPRIHTFIPVTTILEIAPGYGRWTDYLRSQGTRLIGVDLSIRCVEECRRRFQDQPHMEFHANDGTSLAMVSDGSVDFVFSCDSLVHAEADVLAAYLRQLATKLTPNGVGIIHHSNLGTYVDPATGALPPDFENRGWRAQTMTARKFEEQCRSAGLCCIGQEILNWWAGEILSDCFSLFTLPGSTWERANRVVINRHFVDEATSLRATSQLYPTSSFIKASAPAAAAMRAFTWAKHASRRDGMMAAALTSAKRLPLVRQSYRWLRGRLQPQQAYRRRSGG